MDLQKLERIVIVGAPGSGKSTLSGILSQKLHLTYIEADSLFWQENWRPLPDEQLKQVVSEKIKEEKWVFDGNYSRLREITWSNVQTVIWLDYSFCKTFLRLFKRTIKRIFKKEKLWNNNQETFRKAFFSKDSIFLWLKNTYNDTRNNYLDAMESNSYEHIQFIHITNNKHYQNFLKSIKYTC